MFFTLIFDDSFLIFNGEIGANFSLQHLWRTQFAKINNKKVIAENQCEKHNKRAKWP